MTARSSIGDKRSHPMIDIEAEPDEIEILIADVLAAQSEMELAINRLEDLDPRRALALRATLIETALFMATLGDRTEGVRLTS